MSIDTVLNDLGIGVVGGGSNIKGIQRGEASLAGGVTTMNIDVSEVDLTKSIVLIFVDNRTNSTGSANHQYYDDCTATIDFANASQLTVNRYGATGILYFTWVVIEYKKVKSIQRGVANLDFNQTVTISAVDLTKSLLFYSYRINNTNLIAYSTHYKMWLSASNQITVGDRIGATEAVWQVVEFD